MNSISLATSALPATQSWLSSIRKNLFITGRGFALLLFLAYLFAGPVVYETDIVASVLTISLAGIFLALLLTTIIKGYLIKRAFNAELDVTSGEIIHGDKLATNLEFFSHQKSIFILKTSPVKIVPFFVLQLQIVFKDGDLQACEHILTGASEKSRYIREELTFPHRGRWCIGSMVIEFKDRLGISFFSWEISHEDKPVILKVKPHLVDTSTVPVISSRQRSGDTLPDHDRRQGEPFDLKPYHPSDGMRKILWKVYARSGELLARHPEASMTPEGQVIIFALANKHEDAVCGACLSYVQKLKDLDLDVSIGCEGIDLKRPAFDYNSAEEIFLDAVWNSEGSTEESVRADLFHLLKESRADANENKIKNVVIFCSSSRLTSRAGLDILENTAESLTKRDIEPIFVLLDNPLNRDSETKVGKDFIRPFLRAARSNTRSDYYNTFLKNCARNNRQVIICPAPLGYKNL